MERSKGKKGVSQHQNQKNTSSSSPCLLSMGLIQIIMKSNQLLNAIGIALSAGMGGLVIGHHSGIVYSVRRDSHFEFRRDAPTTWLRLVLLVSFSYRLQWYQPENKLQLLAYGCSSTCTSCLKPKGSLSNKKSSKSS